LLTSNHGEHINIFNIHPTYIGFKRTTLGKAYGTKCLGTYWEHKWELGERTLRTKKQPPSSKENKKGSIACMLQFFIG
jgi:hypothetical protein